MLCTIREETNSFYKHFYVCVNAYFDITMEKHPVNKSFTFDMKTIISGLMRNDAFQGEREKTVTL